MVEIEGVTYELEFDPHDHYVVPDFAVAFCDSLAEEFVPVLFDPKGYGDLPYPPDFIAYRLVVDSKGQRMCAIYEVYWRRQDCTWKELNKDHDHDYEQIQVHFNLKTGKREKIIVSSVGPVEFAGHGVEIYSTILNATFRNTSYSTSPKKWFPWGGEFGQNNITQIREIPVDHLIFEEKRPAVLVVNCYHAFTGLKKELAPEEKIELKPKLERLDLKLLNVWYYRNAKNRYGHDISNPFKEPYILYYPPPEDWTSRIAYSLLWVIFSVGRIFLRSTWEDIYRLVLETAIENPEEVSS